MIPFSDETFSSLNFLWAQDRESASSVAKGQLNRPFHCVNFLLGISTAGMFYSVIADARINK